MAAKEQVSDSLQRIIEIYKDLEHEHRLLQLAKKEPNNVFSWAASRDLSRDPLMQGYYLNQIIECIHQNGDTQSYLNGIYYTHHIGRIDLTNELADEMIKKHPIAGRYYKIIFKKLYFS